MGKLVNKLKYYFSKAILYCQIPSIRDCEIDKKTFIGHRSNLIRVKIGKYSYIGNNNSISDTIIGKYCSIASYCAIGGGIHPLTMFSTSPVFYDPHNCFNEQKFLVHHETDFQQPETVIGNDVWIGENCFIKAGVHIGDGVIIGAHSVVLKDVEPYSIVAGNPAKFIRYRFEKEKIDKLLSIKWWDMTNDDLVNYLKQEFQ